MHRTLSRIASVAAGAALAAVGLPASPATAASSASCPEAASTRILTGSVVGYNNKLWVYSPTPSQTIVCFDFYAATVLAAGALVVNTNAGLTPPAVTPGTDPAACTIEVVRILDPVPFRLALGASGMTACFTVNSTTTSVTLGLPGVTGVPSVELWSDASYSWVDFVLCARHTDTATVDACRYTVYRQL